MQICVVHQDRRPRGTDIHAGAAGHTAIARHPAQEAYPVDELTYS